MLPFGEERRIRLSRFCHLFERGETIALVHSLTHTPVYFNRRSTVLVEELRKSTTLATLAKTDVWLEDKEGARSLIKGLVEAKLIVPDEYDECRYLDQVRREVLCGPHFDILFILLTEACNLRCEYCFIEGGKPENYRNTMMTKKTAKAAVDAFIRWKAPDGDKSIVFYGGEPLLNQDAFLCALEYIAEQTERGNLPRKLEKILITNGTLLTKELAEAFVRFGVFPYISIDGPPELHDKQRPFKDGGGSFAAAVRGLDLIRSRPRTAGHAGVAGC